MYSSVEAIPEKNDYIITVFINEDHNDEDDLVDLLVTTAHLQCFIGPEHPTGHERIGFRNEPTISNWNFWRIYLD